MTCVAELMQTVAQRNYKGGSRRHNEKPVTPRRVASVLHIHSLINVLLTGGKVNTERFVAIPNSPLFLVLILPLLPNLVLVDLIYNFLFIFCDYQIST